ncbi:MAG: GMC family oxidoreductase [Actinomycetota bacterium]
MSPASETTDVLVLGTGFGGAIPGYHLAAGGAKVLFLERGPYLKTEEFTHDLQIGTYTRIVDAIIGQGVAVAAGNVVGGSSVVYFAASLRAPAFVFERTQPAGRRVWPRQITRARLDPYYDRVEETLPVAQEDWNDVSFAGGVFAAACRRAGHTCNPVPVAVDLDRCTNCNWMVNGCRFGAKRSMLLNYLPAAEAHGAEIRPLHEVQRIRPAVTPGYRYAVDYLTLSAGDYREYTDGGVVEAKVVILAAGAMGSPVILERSRPSLPLLSRHVGRNFSPNGDLVTTEVVDEGKVRSLLGLSRGTAAYDAYPIGRPITSMTYDFLDPRRREGLRFGMQHIYFPGTLNVIPNDGETHQGFLGLGKRELSRRWRSWVSVLSMVEDGNEGTFGPPPPTGNFVRLAPAAAVATLDYPASEFTLKAFANADREVRRIFEKDGLAKHLEWTGEAAFLSAHPLSSCRMGSSVLDSVVGIDNQVWGYPGLFVTDASTIPTSLCVNPSLTVAAMAERASDRIMRIVPELGVEVRAGVPVPGR